jgi:hypothetical protein
MPGGGATPEQTGTHWQSAPVSSAQATSVWAAQTSPVRAVVQAARPVVAHPWRCQAHTPALQVAVTRTPPVVQPP